MVLRQNPFIQDAATGKRVTRWPRAIALYVAIVLLINIGLFILLTTTWSVTEGSASAQLQEGIATAVTIAAVFAWVFWFERRRIQTLGFHRPRRGAVQLLLGMVIGLTMMSIPVLLLWATGVYESAAPEPDSSSGFSALPVVLVLALTLVVQGSNEEILTRGFLLQNLGLQLPGWVAVVLPTLLFTVLHGNTDPITFATIFVYGLFATFVALQQRSLWLICGIHAGWNWALANIYGLAVSGIPPRTNALFFLEASPGAPDWLTGGENGTEGSLIATVMVTMATLVAFLAWRRRGSTTRKDDAARPVNASSAAEEPTTTPAETVSRPTADD